MSSQCWATYSFDEHKEEVDEHANVNQLQQDIECAH